MKKTLTKFLTFGTLCLLIFQGCKKDGTIVTSNGGTPSVLTASTSTPNLNRTALTATAVTFTATVPVFNYNAVATNTLQIDIKGSNFSKPMEKALDPKAPTLSYTVTELNNFLLGRKIPAGTAVQMEARVKVSLSTDVVASYSNIVNLTATPFNLISYLYVVGAFNGWSTTAADSLFSATGNGVYTGIINFTAGNREFLVLPKKTFDNKYATSDPTGTTTATVKYNGNNNLTAPATAGQYQITLDINQNTITFMQVNLYSVIGSTTAGGNYSTDVDMKYINDGNGAFVGVFAFTAGAFKVRQNHDWTYSWGDISTPNGKDATDVNGKDIAVAAAGNYKVGFTIPITKFGDKPSDTATYTLVKQ